MPDHDLEIPADATNAWDRYRKLMIWMVAASFAATAGGLLLLSAMIGPVPMHMAIATGLGIFFSVLLAAALMGLVFHSAGSGHDNNIHDQIKDTDE